MGKKWSPEAYHLIVAPSSTLAGVVLLFVLFRLDWTWPNLLVAWLLAVNVITFGYYGFDKAQAQDQARRVPEWLLHALVLLGGTLGGYLAMQLFRHKTVKGPFRIVFWLITVLQVLLIAALLYRIWQHSS